MRYTVRNAKMEDLAVIGNIYTYARKFMAENGNPHQWGKTNPPEEVLIEDIRRSVLFVLEEEGDIHGVFYFAQEEDPTYALIEDGSWLSESHYGVIHRIASDGSGGIFSEAVNYCRSLTNHLRIDTHHDNHIMQKVVEKHGFSRRGIIYIADGSPRIAYEWIAQE